MIVGINALRERWPGDEAHRYFCNLWEHLKRHNGVHEYRRLRPNARYYRRGLDARKTMGTIYWDLWGVQREGRLQSIQVLHCPYWASPLFPQQPTVITVPDVNPLLDIPGFEVYRRRLRSRVYYQIMAMATRKADAVITFSNRAAEDVARIIGIPPDRIYVTPLAPQATHRPQPEYRVGEVCVRYRLQRPYVLSIAATFDIRKDLSTTVRAFKLLQETSSETHLGLVIAGDNRRLSLRAADDPRPVAEELGISSDVRLSGLIADEDLPALYSGAKLLICTSVYEGFALSVLEAMACGTPVLVSDIETMRELCGEAAAYAPVGNAQAFADQLLRLSQDKSWANQLRELGREKANEYSWAKTAELTVKVYEKACR
jgi:glycosyltransferase involved in cell wall biosynthesis